MRRVRWFLLLLFVLGELVAFLWWVLPDDLRVMPVLLGLIGLVYLAAVFYPKSPAQHEPVGAGGFLPSPAPTEPLEPMLDMIGSYPLFHGERGNDMDSNHPQACLCGHDPYYLCPQWITGGIASMTFGGEEDEAARRTVLSNEDPDQ
jgi:hypothetical protein